MAHQKFSRRRMLRGMLAGSAVGLGLPLLDIFLNDHGDAMADGSGLPLRFGLWFWGNGNIPQFWTPTGEGEGDAWALSEQLEPLAIHKSRMSVLSGYKVLTGNDIAHKSGASGILTGRKLVLLGGENGTFAAPSIDQAIANHFDGQAFHRSLESGVYIGATGEGTWSFKGEHDQNKPFNQPIDFFTHVFGDTFRLPGDTEVDPRLGLRRSILDGVLEDAANLERELGAHDRQRLDAHMTNIRALETQLARLEEDPPMVGEACMQPANPGEIAVEADRTHFDEIHRLMAEMNAMALACNQTRVVSHWFSKSVNGAQFPGFVDGHHRMTHDEAGDQPLVNEMTKYIMGQLAVFVSALEAVEEGDGTLLDNMLLMATTDCSLGRQHLLEEYPVMFFGNACGRIKEDCHIRSSTLENASKIGLTVTRAMGMTDATFGADAGEASDSIGAVEA